MFGNCAIGSWNTASAPTMTIAIDRTEAKIGRSMKKWENFMRLFLGCRQLFAWSSFAVRLHFRARSHTHKPVDQHPIVRLNPVAHYTQAFDRRAKHHFARL